MHGVTDGRDFKEGTNFVEDDSLVRSKDLTLMEPFVKEAPFVELCGDREMVRVASSFKHMDLTYIESLGLTPISSLLLHNIPSHS